MGMSEARSRGCHSWSRSLRGRQVATSVPAPTNHVTFSMRSSTWASDSHGLYDYEAKTHFVKEFRCRALCDAYEVVRSGTDIKLINEPEAKALKQADDRARTLMKIFWRDGSLWVTGVPFSARDQNVNARNGEISQVSDAGSRGAAEGNQQMPLDGSGVREQPAAGVALRSAAAEGEAAERLWMVVRQKAVKLDEGDVVKLGRFRLKVKEIVMDANSVNKHRFLKNDEDGRETSAPECADKPNGVSPTEQDVQQEGEPTGDVGPAVPSRGISNHVDDQEGVAEEVDEEGWGEHRSQLSLTREMGNRMRSMTEVLDPVPPNRVRAASSISDLAGERRNSGFSSSSSGGGQGAEPPRNPQDDIQTHENFGGWHEGVTEEDEENSDYPSRAGGRRRSGGSQRTACHGELGEQQEGEAAASDDSGSSSASAGEAAVAETDRPPTTGGGNPVDATDAFPRSSPGDLVTAADTPHLEVVPPKPILVKQMSSMGVPTCRICLCEEDQENPVVAPCKCKGSMKWVHLICLRTWMQGQLGIDSEGPGVSFFWRSLECELCKHPYPTYVKIADLPAAELEPQAQSFLKSSSHSGKFKMVELFEIPRPHPPYIILEPELQNGCGLHIISLANAAYARLGRTHDSDIRVSDISVSRFHAKLKFCPPGRQISALGNVACSTSCVANDSSGGFYLEDPNSKFGTLIEVKVPFKIEVGRSFSLQAGRSVLTFSAKKHWSISAAACLKPRRAKPDVQVEVKPNPFLSLAASGTEGPAASRSVGEGVFRSGRQQPRSVISATGNNQMLNAGGQQGALRLPSRPYTAPSQTLRAPTLRESRRLESVVERRPDTTESEGRQMPYGTEHNPRAVSSDHASSSA